MSAISPTLALGRNQAEYVSCAGSGTIEEHMHKNYGSPFCLEPGLTSLRIPTNPLFGHRANVIGTWSTYNSNVGGDGGWATVRRT